MKYKRKNKLYRAFTKKTYKKKIKSRRAKSILSTLSSCRITLNYPIYITAAINPIGPAPYLQATTLGGQPIGDYSFAYASLASQVPFLSNLNVAIGTGNSGSNLRFFRMKANFALARIKQFSLRYVSSYNWSGTPNITMAGPFSLAIRPITQNFTNTRDTLYNNFSYDNNLFISPMNLKYSKRRIYKYPSRLIQSATGATVPLLNAWSSTAVLGATPLGVDAYLCIGTPPQHTFSTQANNLNNHTVMINTQVPSVLIGEAVIDVDWEFSVPLTQ